MGSLFKNSFASSGPHPIIARRRLTTAEILYHLPDHPALLQSFVWQYLDRAPDFPHLNQFLDYWAHNLDGTLHSVRVAQASAAGEVNAAEHFFDFSSSTHVN